MTLRIETTEFADRSLEFGIMERTVRTDFGARPSRPVRMTSCGMMTNWSIEARRLENEEEGLLRGLPRSVKLKAMGPWAGLDVHNRATAAG
jgi:hypothetical protein